jgi:hypothetical protein
MFLINSIFYTQSTSEIINRIPSLGAYKRQKSHAGTNPVSQKLLALCNTYVDNVVNTTWITIVANNANSPAELNLLFLPLVTVWLKMHTKRFSFIPQFCVDICYPLRAVRLIYLKAYIYLGIESSANECISNALNKVIVIYVKINK